MQNALDFHAFLDTHPEWLRLTEQRDAARTAWQARLPQTAELLRASHYVRAAELLEDTTITQYEHAIGDDEADLISRWTGTHPDCSVEIYREIIEHLRDQALRIYGEITQYKKTTQILELTLNQAQKPVSALYDTLRTEFNQLISEADA